MELIELNICNTNRDIGMKSLIIRWGMHNICVTIQCSL